MSIDPSDGDIGAAMRLAGFDEPDRIEIANIRDEHQRFGSWTFLFAHARTLAEMRQLREPMVGHELECEAAFLIALAEHGVLSSIGEVLIQGDGRYCGPGALRKAIAAYDLARANLRKNREVVA